MAVHRSNTAGTIAANRDDKMMIRYDDIRNSCDSKFEGSKMIQMLICSRMPRLRGAPLRLAWPGISEVHYGSAESDQRDLQMICDAKRIRPRHRHGVR